MKITKNGTIEVSITAISSPCTIMWKFSGEDPQTMSISKFGTVIQSIPVKEIEGITEDNKKIRLKEVSLNLGLISFKFAKD